MMIQKPKLNTRQTPSAFATQINELFINSACSILNIANVFVQAKHDLSKTEFDEFLKLTKYAEKSSSVRKWLRIGGAYVRLAPLTDRLPPNWSTIYKLATLKSSELDALIDADVLSRDMTAKNIDAELKPKRKVPIVQIVLEFNASVDALSFEQDYQTVVQSLPLNFCVIKCSKDADTLLQQASVAVQPLRQAA
jgi:hypothetical protein